MADAKLSQAEIDVLLASMGSTTATKTATRSESHTVFDFRRPSKFAREHMRSLESAHEVFQRRFSSLMTHALRSVVAIEPISTDQITYEDYIRSIPNPSVLGSFTVEPLPGTVVVEMSSQMGLTLIDRLLGGIGSPVPMRRPTELESNLLMELMGHVREALNDALAPLEKVDAQIKGIEFNPQFVQATAPSEMVLMLSFTLSVQSPMRTEGMLSICYPFSTLAPAMSKLESHAWHSQQPALEEGGDDPSAPRSRPLERLLPKVPMSVTVQLRDSRVPAADLAALTPGDVIRLEHRVDEPAIGVVGGRQVLRGRLGRKGRRLALQLADWTPE